MKTFAVVVAILAVIVGLVAVAFVAYGRERTWALLGGPNDPGRYDFAAAQRSATDNDALACTATLCTDPDFGLPVYHGDTADLVDALAARLLRTDRLARRVDDGSDAAYARFVTFSPLLRFPDAMDIEARPLADGSAGLRIYARAKLGSQDLGKNRARIERLIDGFEF